MKKGIFISYRSIRREALWLCLSFVIAFGLNVYAILHYATPWSELWSSLLYVLEATAVVYLVLALVRLLVFGLRKLRR